MPTTKPKTPTLFDGPFTCATHPLCLTQSTIQPATAIFDKNQTVKPYGFMQKRLACRHLAPYHVLRRQKNQ